MITFDRASNIYEIQYKYNIAGKIKKSLWKIRNLVEIVVKLLG